MVHNCKHCSSVNVGMCEICEMEGEPDSDGGVRLNGDDGSVDLHGHVALGGDQILVENLICDQ